MSMYQYSIYQKDRVLWAGSEKNLIIHFGLTKDFLAKVDGIEEISFREIGKCLLVKEEVSELRHENTFNTEWKSEYLWIKEEVQEKNITKFSTGKNDKLEKMEKAVRTAREKMNEKTRCFAELKAGGVYDVLYEGRTYKNFIFEGVREFWLVFRSQKFGYIETFPRVRQMVKFKRVVLSDAKEVY